MEPQFAKSWLKSIILQRQMLVRTGQNQRNKALMVKLCDKLKRELAYFNPTGEKIYSFIRTRYASILLIIPGNSSEEKNLKTLNTIYQCDIENQQRRSLSSSTSAPSSTPSQFSFSF